MDGDALVSLVVALVCIAGIGMAATTLTSTVETTPDDAIDFDGSAIPLGAGEVQEYKDRLSSESTDSGGDTGQPQAGDPQADGNAEASSEADGDAAASSDGSGEPRAAGGESDRSEPSPGLPTDSLLDALLEFLRWLLAWLLRLLPLLLAVAALAVAVARRDRLAALVRGRLERPDEPAVGDGGRGRPSPSNDVERAWYEMTALVGLDGREELTPRECARRAVERGASPEAAEAVTRPFEEVRYGGAPVTDDRREQATRGLQRVRGDLGGAT